MAGTPPSRALPIFQIPIVQSADPGAVGSRRLWIDISTPASPALWVRNATNTAWDEAAGADGADGADGQGFNFTGAWASPGPYAPYDVVVYNGSSYVNILASTTEDPSNATYWTEIAAAGADGADGADGGDGQGFNFTGAWASPGPYAPYDVVTYNGESYVNILASTTEDPSNATYWTLMAAAGVDGADGADGVDGVVDTAGYSDGDVPILDTGVFVPFALLDALNGKVSTIFTGYEFAAGEDLDDYDVDLTDGNWTELFTETVQGTGLEGGDLQTVFSLRYSVNGGSDQVINARVTVDSGTPDLLTTQVEAPSGDSTGGDDATLAGALADPLDATSHSILVEVQRTNAGQHVYSTSRSWSFQTDYGTVPVVVGY